MNWSISRNALESTSEESSSNIRNSARLVWPPVQILASNQFDPVDSPLSPNLRHLIFQPLSSPFSRGTSRRLAAEQIANAAYIADADKTTATGRLADSI